MKRFFEIQKIRGMLPQQRGEESVPLQRLAQPLMSGISKGDPSACDPAAAARFLAEVCRIVRAAAIQCGDMYSRSTWVDWCDWARALACLWSVDLETSEVTSRVWAFTNVLAQDKDSLASDDLARQLGLELENSGLATNVLSRIIQEEYVYAVVSRIKADEGDVSELAETKAAALCQELLGSASSFDNQLVNAANHFGIPIPESNTCSNKDGDLVTTFVPEILHVPITRSLDQLYDEWQKCLFQLLSLPESLFSDVTARQILGLTPESDLNNAATVSYFATKELWERFWRDGEADRLELARSLAAFTYSVRTSGQAESRYRNSSLLLLVALQIPDALSVAGIPVIVDEARGLFKAEGCNLSYPALLSAIIQGFAGKCQSEKDPDCREALVILHGDHVRHTHKEYEKSTRDRHSDESEAWGRALLLLGQVEDEGPGRKKVDQTLINLVNRGDHRTVLTYIADQLESIRSSLGQKLTRHLLSEAHLMVPRGKVYLNQGDTRGSISPAFEAAMKLLESGQYARATDDFGDLASSQRLSVRQQSFCKDYQAFALCKLGKFIAAKPELGRLADSNYAYASAYWNLACIETDRQDQLSTLLLGLERAPHLNMLEAAIYLGMVLNITTEDRIMKWLSLAPFLEAQMLFYYFDTRNLEILDDQAKRRRDDLLKRISAYIDHGDPILPDPVTVKLDSTRALDLRDDLMQRDHFAVMGFWLRCHRPYEKKFRNHESNRSKTEYYQLRTELWTALGDLNEAANSFLDELECHLTFLEILLSKDNWVSGNVLADIGPRIEKQLRTCMTSALESRGRKIYRRIQEWEKDNNCRGMLLREDNAFKKIHEAYGSGAETLERVLLRVASELSANLHDLTDLPRYRFHLTDLSRALEEAPKPESCAALGSLLDTWDAMLSMKDIAEREQAVQSAIDQSSKLSGAFQRELGRDEYEITVRGLLHAIKRVNGRQLRGPKIVASQVDEALPTFLGDGHRTAFGIRIAVTSDTGDITITDVASRLLETGTEFRLRDNLEVAPLTLRKETATILTFEDDGTFKFTGSAEFAVEITYDYLGQPSQVSTTVFLETGNANDVSINSPYVFHRELYPDEIEKTFFGREDEQREVIDLITKASSKIGYIEGIRRTGKTSLFNAVKHRLAKEEVAGALNGGRLLLIPLKGGSVTAFAHAGALLHDFFTIIASDPIVSAAGIEAPISEHCLTNMLAAYREFDETLRVRLPEYRIVAFWDDFQGIVDLAEELAAQNPTFPLSARALLDIIRDQRGPDSRIVWLFAGFRSWMKFVDQLPKVNLWAELSRIQIDFLDQHAVKEILTKPLMSASVSISAEAVDRVYDYTKGYPEVVQRIADIAIRSVAAERRCMVLPADVDVAACRIAETPGLFADTWCPLGEISSAQRGIIATFLSVVELGGSIEPHRLSGQGSYTDETRKQIDDLVSRKVFQRLGSGTLVSIKAPVLEMWMRNHWKNEEPALVAAIFVDLANLTRGTGDDVLEFPGLRGGDVVPGKVQLRTVFDAIDKYAADLVPTPVVLKWAINYPPGCDAIVVANIKGYTPVNIDQRLFEKGKSQKGSDDTTLISTIANETSERPAISHVVLVTGDGDLKLVGVQNQLTRGRAVHILTHRERANADLVRMSKTYPQKCQIVYFDELLDRHLETLKSPGFGERTPVEIIV